MNLMEFVSKVPDIRIARKDDNRKILDFYNSFTMSGGTFNIRFDKEPDYFKFLDYEADRHYVLYVGTDDGYVDGMGYLNVRPCYINGKRDYVTHNADLRFRRKRERKTAVDWGDFVTQIFKAPDDIDEFKGCRYFLGSYIESNKFAKKVFTSQEGPFRTSPIAKYQMVCILMRKPLKLLKKSHQSKTDIKISISVANKNDLAELKEFLDKQNRKRTFGFVFGGENGELERRFRVWDDFSISSFYIVRDSSNAIIACVAPWSTTKARRIVVDKYPKFLEILGNMLKITGKKFPAVGQELEILYITHMEFDHELAIEDKRYIFSRLLDAIYDSGVVKQYHMLAYCDYNSETLLPVVERDYIVQKTPTVLYQIYHPDCKDIIVEDKQDVHVVHEMCLM
jgi:hypothetical protein